MTLLCRIGAVAWGGREPAAAGSQAEVLRGGSESEEAPRNGLLPLGEEPLQGG
jgi:hypothetical protein